MPNIGQTAIWTNIYSALLFQQAEEILKRMEKKMVFATLYADNLSENVYKFPFFSSVKT